MRHCTTTNACSVLEYDYRLPGREYRTAAFHLSDEIQQHLPASLNNHLPYFPDASSFNIQHLSSETQARLAPIRPSPKSMSSFITILILVAALLLLAVFGSRLVRAVRRRRFFASRAKESDYSICKEKDEQDYVLSPFVEKPKLRLSPPAPGSPIDEQETGAGSAVDGANMFEQNRYDLGRDSPV